MSEISAKEEHSHGNLQNRATKVEALVRTFENMRTFRDRGRKWYERYKKDEQEKKPDALDSLSPPKPPSWRKNSSLAHIYNVFQMPEEPQPSDKLSALARYVKLTILHDTKLPFCTRINDGIFPENEPFVQAICRDLVNPSPETIAEIDADLASVEADLQARAKTNPTEASDGQPQKSIPSAVEGNGGQNKAGDITSQEWSKPMSKAEMMKALGIDDIKKFNKWAAQYGIKKLGQKTFQIRLDNMDKRSRQRLDPEKI